MEQVPGRHEVVEQERPDRDGRAERRPTGRAAATSRRRRRAGRTAPRTRSSAGPCRRDRTGARPGTGGGRCPCEASDAVRAPIPAAPRRRVARRPRAVHRRAGRPRRRPRPGRRPARRPTERSASPTARTWAWYQVVPSWAAYQKTVPKPKNSGRSHADRRAAPAAARASTRRCRRRSRRGSRRAAGRRSSGPTARRTAAGTTAGSGGNGMSPRGTPSSDATGRTSLKQALPLHGFVGSRPGSGSRSGPRGTPPPAIRSGRRYGTAGSRCRRTGPSARSRVRSRSRPRYPSTGNPRTVRRRPWLVVTDRKAANDPVLPCDPPQHVRPGGQLP